jgi:dynamin 1-like protein
MYAAVAACLQVTVELKLGLPQVAVVGSQSSGKSSVLEALVSSNIISLVSSV